MIRMLFCDICSMVLIITLPFERVVAYSVERTFSINAETRSPELISQNTIPDPGGAGERLNPVLMPECSPWPHTTMGRRNVRCGARFFLRLPRVRGVRVDAPVDPDAVLPCIALRDGLFDLVSRYWFLTKICSFVSVFPSQASTANSMMLYSSCVFPGNG